MNEPRHPRYSEGRPPVTSEFDTGASTRRAVQREQVRAEAAYAGKAHTHDAADLTTGTVAPARLGSGSGGATKFLREDNTWQNVAGGATPTGTGFRHVTAGVEDAAAKLVDTADINNAQVTLAKMADLTGPTAIGRDSGTGAPLALTTAQITTLVDVFTSVLKGAVPASGGGTTNFLRADGTWAAPSGSGGLEDFNVRRRISLRI